MYIIINIPPKNNLPKAKTFGSMVFSTCFDITFSTAQNTVAIKIKSAPIFSSKEFIFNNKKFPANKRNAGITNFFDICSFRNIVASRATRINMLLWIKEPIGPLLICNPLKNSTKGTEPPIKPIKISQSHCCLFNSLRFLNSLNHSIIASRKKATIIFFRNVNIVESMFDTPNLFMNMEVPDIKAVNNISITPWFFI